MFKTRLLSGIILVLLAIFFIGTGGISLLLALLVISGIGIFELYRIFHIEKTVLGGCGYLALLLYYLDLRWKFLPDQIIIVMGLLIFIMFAYVFSYPKYNTQQVMAAFFGVFYVGVMLACIYRVRVIPQGAYVVWLIFLSSWGSDTCAYCVGVKFGKHKMSPVLSPKKSVEGAIGGVIGSILLTGIYCVWFQRQMHLRIEDILLLSLISGCSALVSMVGDLAASAIKRNYEIKDYGRLIPGHGGILDRFDSVIFTAPVIYYLSSLVLFKR